MCDDDYEGVVILQDCWRKARRAHRCFACAEEIRPGDRYHLVVQKSEGDLDHFKHCARCHAMVRAIFRAGALSVQWDLDCGVEWEEEFGELPDSVARLAFLTPDEAQREIEQGSSDLLIGKP